MRRARAFAAILAVLAVAAEGVRAEEQAAKPAGAATSTDATNPPRQGNPLWAVPLASLRATRDRPLFSPTRRPPAMEPPPAALAPPEPVAPPAAVAGPETAPFELVGTVLGGDGDLAVLRNPSSNAISRLRAGQQKDGWHVVKVEGRRIVLEKNGAATTLEMMKPDSAAALPRESEAPAGEVAQKGLVVQKPD